MPFSSVIVYSDTSLEFFCDKVSLTMLRFDSLTSVEKLSDKFLCTMMRFWFVLVRSINDQGRSSHFCITAMIVIIEVIISHHTPNLVHAEALSAPHLLTAVWHQRLVPQPSRGVAAQYSSISQEKGPSTFDARGTAPSLPTLPSENSPIPESRFGISQNSTNAGKLFWVESVLIQRIIQFELLISTSKLAISNTLSNGEAD